MADVSMKQLFEAGAHFGHLTRFRNPRMSDFIYGTRNSVSIINLEKTLPLFSNAIDYARRTAAHGGKILFVGTKLAAQDIVAEYATQCGMPYVNYRWLGGMLTNFKTIKQSIRRFKELQQMKDDGTILQLTKKEGLTIERELEKLQRSLAGIKEMGGLPDALFIVDVGQEKIAIHEAKILGIPVIGVVDTNSSPENITYPIPANDDAKRAITLYASTIAKAIIEGKEAQRAQAAGKYQEEFVEVDEGGAQEES